jgi:hypothetical protein
VRCSQKNIGKGGSGLCTFDREVSGAGRGLIKGWGTDPVRDRNSKNGVVEVRI